MEDSPIQGLMKTAMENIKEMVDVNTIVGDPVETQDGTVIIPVSRVAFGFAAGGAQYDAAAEGQGNGGARGGGGNGGGGGANNGGNGGNGNAGGAGENDLGFGGGSGGGVTIHPVGFLVVAKDNVRLLPVDRTAVLDRLLDMAPHLLDRFSGKQEKTTQARTEGPKV